MKTSTISNTFLVYSFFAMILFLLPSNESAALPINDLVQLTCKQTPLYQFCVSAFRSDPSCCGADNKDLALEAVNIIKNKAAATRTQINDLLKAKPELKAPLSACADSYNAILQGDVPQATEALTKGDYKFAEQGANDAATEASSCEKGFPGSSSPITAENTYVQNISTVAAAIVRLLLF